MDYTNAGKETASLSIYIYFFETPSQRTAILCMLSHITCSLNQPHVSVGSRALDLKTRGCGFDSRAGQPSNF